MYVCKDSAASAYAYDARNYEYLPIYLYLYHTYCILYPCREIGIKES